MLVNVEQKGDLLQVMQKERVIARVRRIVLAEVIFFPNQKILSGRLYRSRWLRALETQLEFGPDECMDSMVMEWDGEYWMGENGPLDYASFVDINLDDYCSGCPFLAIRRPEDSFDHMPLLEV